MLFRKGLFLKTKAIKSKRIGLFYLAISAESSSGILTIKFSVFPFFFLPYISLSRALALNCDAPLDDKNGAESKNWRAGKPVRVVRSSKGRRISKYAPEEGNRYDGIYKVLWFLLSAT